MDDKLQKALFSQTENIKQGFDNIQFINNMSYQ